MAGDGADGEQGGESLFSFRGMMRMIAVYLVLSWVLSQVTRTMAPPPPPIDPETARALQATLHPVLNLWQDGDDFVRPIPFYTPFYTLYTLYTNTRTTHTLHCIVWLDGR